MSLKLITHLFSQLPSNCSGKGCATNLPEVSANSNTLEKILPIVFGIVGALAVLTLVASAYNLTTGGGDPDKISRAKNGIIFALVGLAIAVSAEFIVLTFLKNF